MHAERPQRGTKQGLGDNVPSELGQLYAELAAVRRQNAGQAAQIRELKSRLEGLDQLKADFLNAASHELRTPLTSIKGYAEFLEDEVGGVLTPEWRAMFEKYPDRFLLGSDTWISERWASYGSIMAEYRGWLKQLPPGIAKQIAHGNAKRLFAEK